MPLLANKAFGLLCCTFWSEALVLQQDLYSSPCPDTFRYQQDQNGQLYGTIGIYTFDENVVRLNVELSVPNQVNNYNGHIELIQPKEQVIVDIFEKRPIRYKIFFPRWENVPPRITKISVNGEVVCAGPRIAVGGGVKVLTNINLQHTLTVNTVPLQAKGNPFIRNQNEDDTFKPQVSKNSIDRNPFFTGLGSATSTTTEKSSDDAIPNLSKNPFLNGNVQVPPVTNAVSKKEESTPSPPRRFSAQNEPSSDSDVCGVPVVPVPLIVNGDAVPRGAFPWLVAVFAVTGTGLEYQCGGSLISDRHVLTAAHCVEKGRQKIRADRLVFVLGKHNLKRWGSGDGERMVEAEDIVVHPDYVPLTADADVAVAVLRESVPFTRYIRPICLWSESDDLKAVVGQRGKVVGWGRDENNNTMTAEPRQTTVPIVSQEQCLRSAEAFRFVTSSRTFCAGDRNGSGPCYGDSGGGFIMKRNGRWMLRGVVSISTYDETRQTCDLSNYVVFTDVSKFRTWLFSFTVQ